MASISTKRPEAVLQLLRQKAGSTVVPGDRLSVGSKRNFQVVPGPGTYLRAGHVYASVAGRLQVLDAMEEKDDETNDSSKQKPSTAAKIPSIALTVKPSNGRPLAHESVLRPGQVVLGRIVRLSQQQATVQILLAAAAKEEGVRMPLLQHCPEGAIRREDVRTAATEQVQILLNSFRPGDLVLARTLAAGDTRRYFLSTAEPALGVIHALSATSGQPMIPVSWREMECRQTGAREARKCARPKPVSSVLPATLQGGSAEQTAAVATDAT